MKTYYLTVLLTSLFLFSCNTSTREESNSTEYNTLIPNHLKKVKVIGIKDGDTIEVLTDGKKETVRLFAIDCPESSQPFGKAAKKFTSDICFGKYVNVEPQPKRDQYNRILGTVFIDDTICLNKELLKAGYAWHYKRYSNNETYSYLENTAHSKHIGLWQDTDPTPPWNWRKENKRK